VITLLTGLPGNGKTLFALYTIKALADKDQREVFYHNIKDLNLGWTEFKPEGWMDLPNGAVIVIDEAQDVFPRKPNGAQLPAWYTELAKHRHKGFDIFVITQHPTLLDNFVRQLVGRHFHVVRKFGLERATVYEWSAANVAPQLASSQKTAIPLKWGYPKEVYGYYKSAEVHTVKKSIPMKLVLAVLFVVAMIGVGYWSLDRFQHRADAKSEKPVAGVQAATGSPVAPLSPASVLKPAFDPIADARSYITANTPRVAGLPQTAPKYDEMTKPVRVPVPAACVSSKSMCKCFTQQGTAMDVGADMCHAFVRSGFFEEFDADHDRLAGKAARSSAMLDARASAAPAMN
jgi:zona occludens toxin